MATKATTDRDTDFKTITPSYFGNPVAIVSSINSDGSPNLAPISSFWGLGWTVVLGILCDTQTFENFQSRIDCVVNVPSPDLWETVERLAPLTGKNPTPPEKALLLVLLGEHSGPIPIFHRVGTTALIHDHSGSGDAPYSNGATV